MGWQEVVKLLIPVAILCATVVRAGIGLMVNSIVKVVAIPIATAIATLMANRRTKPTVNAATDRSIPHAPFLLAAAEF